MMGVIEKCLGLHDHRDTVASRARANFLFDGISEMQFLQKNSEKRLLLYLRVSIIRLLCKDLFMDGPVQIVQLFYINSKWLLYFLLLVSRMTDVISEKFKLHMILGETYHSLQGQNMSIIFKNMNDMIGINSLSYLWPVNNGQNSFEQ